jgi:3-deoxy-D-manno-octulosonic-acid transferase
VTDTVAGAEALAAELGIDRSRPLIVAGSTAPGEEAMLHASMPEGVQLLCAPRRPEHFDTAASDLPGCVRRSQKRAAPAGTTRYLLDTIGELRKAYALADVAVIGRSFGKLYGSDPMEAAALGKPVVIGPNTANFRTTVQAMERDGAIIVTSARDVGQVLERLIDHPDERQAMGERARACVLSHKGATERHARLLLEVMGLSGVGTGVEPRQDLAGASA